MTRLKTLKTPLIMLVLTLSGYYLGITQKEVQEVEKIVELPIEKVIEVEKIVEVEKVVELKAPDPIVQIVQKPPEIITRIEKEPCTAEPLPAPNQVEAKPKDKTQETIFTINPQFIEPFDPS